MVHADPDDGPAREDAPVSAATLPPIQPDDDGLQIYTSGTTGRPKAVVISHRGLLAAGASAAGAHRLSGFTAVLERVTSDPMLGIPDLAPDPLASPSGRVEEAVT